MTATAAANSGTAARTGVVALGSTSIAITQDGAPAAPCSFKLTPSINPVPAQGGDFSLDVATDAHCKWDVSSSHDWMSASSTGMTGSGRVPFGVRPNAGDPRSGRLVVGTAAVTIGQDGCVTSIAPDAQKLPSGSASGKISVTALAGCEWALKATAWILRVPEKGIGSQSFAFLVEANSGPQRTGTIEIGGRKVDVIQDGFYKGAVAW